MIENTTQSISIPEKVFQDTNHKEEVVSHKQCKKCHKIKILEDFNKNINCKDGREGQCKACKLSADKVRREDKKKGPPAPPISGLKKKPVRVHDGPSIWAPPLVEAMEETRDAVNSRLEKVVFEASGQSVRENIYDAIVENISFPQVTVYFDQYPTLYAFLKETARIEFRTVENQLLYFINNIYESTRMMDL